MFDGDRDHTVQQTNGSKIVAQASQAHAAAEAGEILRVVTERGSS